MIQKHTIVIWKKSNRNVAHENLIFQETYSILKILSKFPKELQANYIATEKRSDVKPFHLNERNLLNLLQISADESCRLEFYSSLKEEESASISIDIGNGDEFYDTVIIGIPLSMNVFDTKDAEVIRRLFFELIASSTPFWGCVSNRVIARKRGSYLDGDLPNAVFWLNYWSKSVQNAVGVSRIKKATKKFQDVHFDNGIFCIKDIALDAESASDMDYIRKVENCLKVGDKG